MSRGVDWSKSVYEVSVASPAMRYSLRSCCECKKRIRVGERFKRGPRGKTNIHEACVPTWAMRQKR